MQRYLFFIFLIIFECSLCKANKEHNIGVPSIEYRVDVFNPDTLIITTKPIKKITIIKKNICEKIDYLEKPIGIIPGNRMYLPDSLNSELLDIKYKKMENFFSKNKFFDNLYHLVFVDGNKDYKRERVNIIRSANSEARFKEHNGKIIRSIRILVLSPFEDCNLEKVNFVHRCDTNFFYTVGKTLHSKTSKNYILKQITLKEGMRFNSFEAAENELLIKKLNNVSDAIIVVTNSSDSFVDLLLIDRDKFSWSLDFETNLTSTYIAEVENTNLFGRGHNISYKFGYRGSKDVKYDNEIQYSIKSMWGSHIDLNLQYKRNYKEKFATFSLNKEFITSSTKLAGGVEFMRMFYSNNLPDKTNIQDLDTLFNYRSFDGWSGYSLKLKPRYSYNQNLYFTTRFYSIIFNKNDKNTFNKDFLFFNRINTLASFGYTKIKYYNANLIYDFGEIEFVPTGLSAFLLGGYQHNEEDENFYIGSQFSYTYFNPQSERISAFYLGLGSYYNNKKHLNRAFLKTEIKNISNLMPFFWNTRIRVFNSLSYEAGYRRYPNEYLYISDDDIRGFKSDSVKGFQKLSLSATMTVFNSFAVKGFRSSMSFFVDASIMKKETKSLLKSPNYWTLGLKINIRNNNIAFKNISIRFSFYPKTPPDMSGIKYMMTSSREDNFYDYKVSRPNIIEYK